MPAVAQTFDRFGRVDCLVNSAGLTTRGTLLATTPEPFDDWVERAARSQPMGKLGQVDEIADFVVFLASTRSRVVTGSVVDPDQVVPGTHD